MKSKKKYETGESKSTSLYVQNAEDPCQRGLGILARMIAEAYIEETKQTRFVEIGVKPLYIEKIKIALDRMNINDAKARQKLHAYIDQAIEMAEFEGLTENSPPLVLKKDGLSIWLKI